jgi:hypothetical protein
VDEPFPKTIFAIHEIVLPLLPHKSKDGIEEDRNV